MRFTPQCKYNQRGFCRYGAQCRQRHVNESCGNSDCQDESCLLRHPYKCKYFYLYGTCKFGDDCAYVHGESEDKVRIRCLEEKLSMFEAKVILLERSISELVIKLDTFMCMDNSEDRSIDTATDVTEEVIDTEPLKQQEDKFSCHLCDFVSNRPYGLVIHKGRKHKNGTSSPMRQFDGNDTTGTIIDTNDAEDIDDELYKETEHYWKRGWLGMSYQTFKDATKIIDESDLNEEEKQHGDGFVNFPSWRRL